jgi:porin
MAFMIPGNSFPVIQSGFSLDGIAAASMPCQSAKVYRASLTLPECLRQKSNPNTFMKILHLIRSTGRLARLAAVLLCAVTTPAPAQSSIEEWWNGKGATGEWFGARPVLEDHGLKFWGWWQGTFYGVTGGGLQQRGAFNEEIHLFAKLDLEKLAGIPGLSIEGAVRWRDGTDPNKYVGASPFFNPSIYQAGKQWRLMPFYATWESRDLLFGVKDFLTISGGWQNPMFLFAVQPDSKFFTNNSIFQIKGIGANGIPFNGAYTAWGGYIKIKPTDWLYTQHGLYLAIPGGADTANHGLDFQGAYPPDSNGLWYIGEAGVTPKIGPAKLPGKYTIGGYYFGLENTSFHGAPYDGRYGFYFQADQMLYREPSPAPEPAFFSKGATDAKAIADGKSFKSIEEPAAPKLSDQGLYMINFINYAPKYNNLLPFYFHTGLLYKGPFPGRDKDTIGAAFMYGNFSYYRIDARQSAGLSIQKTYEAVVEIDYRFAVNDFIYVQPFWQYIIRPSGTGTIENANILGVSARVTF